jgi:hypothetical protein
VDTKGAKLIIIKTRAMRKHITLLFRVLYWWDKTASVVNIQTKKDAQRKNSTVNFYAYSF